MINLKNKKIIIITSVILLFIFILSIIISIRIINKNNKIKENNVIIVISQKIDNEIKEVYREKFTDELKYIYYYESYINKGKGNKVIIENGKCYITESSCPTHSCENYLLTNEKDFLNPSTTITCLPNGLYISLERG